MMALFPSSELLGYDHVSLRDINLRINNRLVACDSAEWFAGSQNIHHIGLLSFGTPNP